MPNFFRKYGRMLRAPENFLPPELVAAVNGGQLDEERRGFLRKSFLAASASLGAGSALAQTAAVLGADGDPNILVLPEHSRYRQSRRLARKYGPMKTAVNTCRPTLRRRAWHSARSI